MKEVTYTVKDLAVELKQSETTIRKYINEGKLKKIQGIGSVLVTRTELLKFIGNENVNPLSPYERKRLELELQSKDNEIVKLKQILANILGCTGEYAMMWAKGEFN